MFTEPNLFSLSLCLVLPSQILSLVDLNHKFVYSYSLREVDLVESFLKGLLLIKRYQGLPPRVWSLRLCWRSFISFVVLGYRGNHRTKSEGKQVRYLQITHGLIYENTPIFVLMLIQVSVVRVSDHPLLSICYQRHLTLSFSIFTSGSTVSKRQIHPYFPKCLLFCKPDIESPTHSRTMYLCPHSLSRPRSFTFPYLCPLSYLTDNPLTFSWSDRSCIQSTFPYPSFTSVGPY